MVLFNGWFAGAHHCPDRLRAERFTRPNSYRSESNHSIFSHTQRIAYPNRNHHFHAHQHRYPNHHPYSHQYAHSHHYPHPHSPSDGRLHH